MLAIVKFPQAALAILPNEDKPKIKIWIEIILQVSLLACFTYVIREILNWGLPDLVPGNPIKYAIIIMAPIMFTQQEELILKMKHVIT